MKRKVLSALLAAALLLSLTPAAFAEGVNKDSYTMSVVIPEEHYNVGDSFTVDIRAAAVENSCFASFGFQITYDQTALSLTAVTTNLEGAWASSTSSGKGGYAIIGTDPIAVGTDAIPIAQATFTVTAAKATETIGLDSVEMTYPNELQSPTPETAADTVALHDIQVTLSSGDHAAFTGEGDAAITAYAKYEEAGLYSDAARQTALTMPDYTADPGYRLRDKSGEDLWADGTDGYQSNADVLAKSWTENKTLTLQTVQTHTIDFAVGENGSLENTTQLVVDTGTWLKNVNLPPYTPTLGYAFAGWLADQTKVDLDTHVVEGDITLTATFDHANYGITFTTSQAGTFESITGLTEGKATHGTDVTFTVARIEPYEIQSVQYRVGNGSPVTLTPQSGTYTIPADRITDAITVTIQAKGLVTVDFTTGANGSVGGTTSFSIAEGNRLSEVQLESVTHTPEPGYRFDGWYVGETRYSDTQILELTLTTDMHFVARFVHAAYTVTAEGLTGVETTATHGTAFTFTPTKTDAIITGVAATIGGATLTVTPNTDGSYTIAGAAIIGDITITATEVSGSFAFISAADYKGLENNTQVLIFKTTNLGDSNSYQLKDNTTLYRSDKYNGEGGTSYLQIVDAAKTAAQLAQGLTKTNTAPTEIVYGDLNHQDGLTPVDAALINNVLHGRVTDGSNTPLALTTLQRLQADYNGSGVVTTDDMVAVLQKSV